MTNKKGQTESTMKKKPEPMKKSPAPMKDSSMKKKPEQEKKSGEKSNEKKSDKEKEPEPHPSQTQGSGVEYNAEEQPSSSNREQPSSSNQEPVIEILESTPKSRKSVNSYDSGKPDFDYEEEEEQRRAEKNREEMPSLEEPPKKVNLTPNRRSSAPILTPNLRSKMGAAFERKINGPPVSTYCSIPGTQNIGQQSWQSSYYDNVPGSSGDAVEERAQSAPPMEIEDNFDNLVLKMDDALKEDLTNKGIPSDIQKELLFHGCNDRKSFAYAIDPFRIPQIIHHSNPYRLEHHKNRWSSILNLYLNEVKNAIAQEEVLATAKRKNDA